MSGRRRSLFVGAQVVLGHHLYGLAHGADQLLMRPIGGTRPSLPAVREAHAGHAAQAHAAARRPHSRRARRTCIARKFPSVDGHRGAGFNKPPSRCQPDNAGPDHRETVRARFAGKRGGFLGAPPRQRPTGPPMAIVMNDGLFAHAHRLESRSGRAERPRAHRYSNQLVTTNLQPGPPLRLRPRRSVVRRSPNPADRRATRSGRPCHPGEETTSRDY